MKLNLIYLFVALVLASCASTKTTSKITPVGDWDYMITGTPEGDFKGVLNVTAAGTGYAAKMLSAAGEAPLQKFAYDPTTKKVTGAVPYNEFMVDMDATVAADEMTGSMSAGGMSFPFKATRKK
jgi:hypothetical protein